MNDLEEEPFLSFAVDPPSSQAPPAVTQHTFHRPHSAHKWKDQINKYADRDNSEVLDDSMHNMEAPFVPFTVDLPPSQAPLAVTQQSFHRPQSAQDWENQKPKIAMLYKSNDLKETMRIMEQQHGFKATYAISL